jgi:hypothetical protein
VTSDGHPRRASPLAGPAFLWAVSWWAHRLALPSKLTWWFRPSQQRNADRPRMCGGTRGGMPRCAVWPGGLLRGPGLNGTTVERAGGWYSPWLMNCALDDIPSTQPPPTQIPDTQRPAQRAAHPDRAPPRIWSLADGPGDRCPACPGAVTGRTGGGGPCGPCAATADPRPTLKRTPLRQQPLGVPTWNKSPAREQGGQACTAWTQALQAGEDDRGSGCLDRVLVAGSGGDPEHMDRERRRFQQYGQIVAPTNDAAKGRKD